MNPLDDMFRDGLGGRKGEIPEDMWTRVNAGRTPAVPEGEGVDQYFSDALKDSRGEVPTDMWSRISAGGVPVPASLDQTFAEGLRGLTGTVPVGMWDKIWRAQTAPLFPVAGRWAAAASVLLLLLAGLWLLDHQANQAEAANNIAVTEDHLSATNGINNDLAVNNNNTGAAAGAGNGGGANTPPSTPSVTSVGESNTNEIIAFSINDEEYAYVATAVPEETAAVDPAAVEETPDLAAETVTGSAGPSRQKARFTTRREDTPAATPGLIFDTGVVTTLPVVAPIVEVKKQYLPRRDELSATTFRAAPRHRLKAELLFGAFYANQQFAAMTDDQLIPREIRNLNENPDLSYQVTLRGSYNLNERFHLLGGLTYAEIRNEFAYTQVTGGQTRDVRTTNRLRMLEAPLLLGLRMPGRRMTVSLNAGPVVNLAFSARGRFIHPDALAPLNLENDGNYRKNVGVGFMSSLSINYKIGRKDPFVLMVEPFFKGYPTSFTVKDAPLRESYWAAGVQFGVRKGF